MRRPAFCERRHLAPEQRGVAGLVAVGHDHDARARMQHARGVPAVEGLQGFADLRAAAGALRHDRETIERARGILFLHRVGDVGEPCVKQERFGFAKFIEHAVDEAQEHAVYMLIEPEASSSTTGAAAFACAAA